MKTILSKSLLGVFFCFCTFVSMASNRYVECDIAPYEEVNGLENTRSALPNVVNIIGLSTAPKYIAEGYRCEVEGVLPEGAYIEWVIYPEEGCEFNNGHNTGSGVTLTFRKDGEYCLTAQIHSPYAPVGLSRYMWITVKN